MKNILQKSFFILFFWIVVINNFYAQQKTFELMKSRIENKQMLSDEAQGFIDKIKAKEVTKSVWIFTTESTEEIEISSNISLDLFEDGKYVAEKIDVVKISDNKFLWKGKIGEMGTATIFYNNGRITASINSGFDSYRIEPIQGGFHLLIKNDREVINKAKCGSEDIEFPNRNERDFYEQMIKIESVTPKQDILVAYTSEVAANHSDMEGFIQTVIGDVEAVYANSSIAIDLRLVHFVEIDYTETEDLSVDLNAFDSNSLIQSLRNKYLADCCILLVDDPESCGGNCIIVGVAWQYGGSSNAFAVVVDDYAGSSNWTLAHEIGHIQGAHHDYDHDHNVNFPYGHGFVSISGDLRTVMAYDNSNCPGQSCTKIGYFSNPNKTVNGVVIGSTQREDNSRVLNETSNQIGGFRNATLSGTLSHDEFWQDSYTLQGNVFVPTGKTLTINSNGSVNLNGYYIKSTGGLIVQNGSISGLNAYLKSGSTLKGLFPTIQLAINNASSYQTVELLSKTYSGSLSFSSKSNLYLTGQSSTTTTVTGHISVTNSNFININNLKLNGSVSINNSLNTNIYSSNINSSSLASDYYGTSTAFSFNSGVLGGASFGYTSYGGTGDVYYSDISLYDCAVYLVNNASYNVGTNNVFCENGYDIDATAGAYAYAISNDYTSPVPYSIHGNVFITGINGVCGSLKPINKSSVFDEGNYYEDELLKKTDDKYLALLRFIRKTKGDGDFEIEKYKSLFNKLVVEYKSIFENAPDRNTSIYALRKISHLYNTTGQNEIFYSYINELLKNDKFSSIKNDIERFNVWNLVDKEDYKGAIDLINKFTRTAKEGDSLNCELKYEEGLIYKYYLEDFDLANSTFNYVIQNYPAHILSNFALAEIIDNTEMLTKNSTVSNVDVSQYSILNYPNPFNPSTIISYSIPAAQKVTIKVYDILGNEITTLVNEVKTAGNHQVSFNAGSLASGIYIYTFQADNFTASKKMLLIK